MSRPPMGMGPKMRCSVYDPIAVMPRFKDGERLPATGCDANGRANKNRNPNDPICEVCGRELTGEGICLLYTSDAADDS